MNKYQEFAVKQIKIIGDKTLRSFKWDYNKIVLEQNENYNLTKYIISIHQASVVKVEYQKNNQICLGNKIDEYQHTIELDFNDKIESIKLYFTLDIVDPVDIKVEYIDVDKSIYDTKLQVEHQKELTEKANIEVKTGGNVIKVNFQPINDLFLYSKVELYSVSEKVINGKRNKTYQLMAKYKTPEDVYFHSITGLAYGKYAVILIEYDANNNAIYKSDYIEVSLNAPNYSGRHQVCI